MSIYDIRIDAPGMLRAEAMNITLTFTRTGPTTGRVSWNIPVPAAGCAAGTQAYDGMLVTIDTTASTITKIPSNGTVYTADATVNTNMFAGDYIASSMVVGAFYNNTATTFFDITELQPNTPYFVTGFPVDAQYRYFIEGVHAYSMDFANKGSPDTHGSQIAVLNPEQSTMGAAPTDSTGLDPTLTYDFNIRVGLVPAPLSPVQSTDCIPQAPVYNIVVDGANSQDFQHLVVEINKQLALATNNIQGATPPNTGSYYWNAAQQQLFLWDGSVHNLVSNVIVQATAPSVVTTGTYWHNITTDVLSVWSGSAWVPVVVVKFGASPTTPQADTTYWYNSTNQHGYLWNGAAWCDNLTYNQSTDPSVPIPPSAGSYWFNTTNLLTYKWNDVLGMWVVVTAINYLSDPNTLTTADYWFDTTTNVLYEYGTPTPTAWNAQSNVRITEITPLTPAVNTFWYNPITSVLKKYDGAAWNVATVMTFAVDPTIRTSCGLWWNTATNVLKVWDSIGAVWAAALYVYHQGVDPTIPLPITDGTLWYNTTTNALSVWSNNCFTIVPSINWATNPINMVDGVAWFNAATNVWNIRQSGVWVIIAPTSTTQNPTNLTIGSFWFKTSPTIGLQQWNGASWVTILYSTALLTPIRGSTWFNTGNSTLMVWTGTAWGVGTPTATCELDCHGNLLFTDTAVGGLSFITLMDGTMFRSLITRFIFHDQTPGTDGASSQASYNEIGIGTDGSVEERLALHNEIRYEMGYPAVDVEVSPEQLNYAIDKALSEFRARSSLAYKRGFFFMAILAENQKFVLTSKISGMNKIVDIMGVYRLTSSFLASAHGAGVYGQIVVQHLYNMGTFDLLSYHIMAEYTKLMEILFAARVTFTWNEQTRVLHLHNRFPFNERQVSIEATVERTEQDLLTDRYTKPWLRRYALATVRIMLAETRGKFASLPGAGGSITLNAAELRQAAATEIEACLMEIDQFIADRPEEYGKFDFCFG
jgi:hypothetical protein